MFARARMGALLALAAVAIGACGVLERSGYQFVRSPSTGTYLKVPQDWEVYGRREINQEMAKSGTGEADAFPFLSVFDAGSPPNVFFDPAGAAPKGVVRVRELEPAERDRTSFASARQELFGQLNDRVAAGAYDLLSATEVKSGPARGQRVVFTSADDDGNAFVVDQVSLVDLDTNRLHFLAVACSVACYDRNKAQIEAVVTSLTVKER